MRNRLLLGFVFALTLSPAASWAAVSPVLAAGGTADHVYDRLGGGRCESEGAYVVAVDLLLRSAMLVGGSPCGATRESWGGSDCAIEVRGAVRCARSTEGATSELTLGEDGAFAYRHRYSSGSSETVEGLLTRGPLPITTPAYRTVEAGPDADGDCTPAYVRLVERTTTVENHGPETSTAVGQSVYTPAVVHRAGEEAERVEVDANDADPTRPVPTRTPEYPYSVQNGPDADADRVPAYVRLFYRTTGFSTCGSVAHSNTRTIDTPIDPDDYDPMNPTRRTPEYPYAVAPGPDADGDGIPAYVRVSYRRTSLPSFTQPVHEPTRFEDILVDPDDTRRNP